VRVATAHGYFGRGAGLGERKNGYSVVRDLCGHGIGTHIHEEPNVLNYGEPGRGLRLQKHGVRNRANGECGDRMSGCSKTMTAVTTDGTNSAHFEHTVAVTEWALGVDASPRNAGPSW